MDEVIAPIESVTEAEPRVVQIHPLLATAWEGPRHKSVRTLDDDGLDQLRQAANENAVWIEARTEQLDEAHQTWFDGTYDVWGSIPTPLVDWSPAADVLDAVGLDVPAVIPRDGERAKEGFLRAIPYVYNRGAFGTVRDALSDGIAAELKQEWGEDLLTAFPTVGFLPSDTEEDRPGSEYTTLRTIVAVARGVVITVRLPDLLFAPKVDGGRQPSGSPNVPLRVPTRFLPLRTKPSARAVAEAIGIHQASTARAVANEIRERLAENEERAGELNKRSEDERKSRRPQLQKTVVGTVEETDRLAEIAHQLDGQIAQLLRRFGSGTTDASSPAGALVPAEVERRYGFARDEIRSLYEDCRHSSQVIRQSLSVYEQGQREQFQFIAALLASIVLIPTLIVDIFGANVNVPAEKNSMSFPALGLFIAGLIATGFWTFYIGQKNNWDPARRKFIPPGIAALLIAAAFVAFLATS